MSFTLSFCNLQTLEHIANTNGQENLSAKEKDLEEVMRRWLRLGVRSVVIGELVGAKGEGEKAQETQQFLEQLLQEECVFWTEDKISEVFAIACPKITASGEESRNHYAHIHNTMGTTSEEQLCSLIEQEKEYLKNRIQNEQQLEEREQLLERCKHLRSFQGLGNQIKGRCIEELLQLASDLNHPQYTKAIINEMPLICAGVIEYGKDSKIMRMRKNREHLKILLSQPERSAELFKELDNGGDPMKLFEESYSQVRHKLDDDDVAIVLISQHLKKSLENPNLRAIEKGIEAVGAFLMHQNSSWRNVMHDHLQASDESAPPRVKSHNIHNTDVNDAIRWITWCVSPEVVENQKRFSSIEHCEEQFVSPALFRGSEQVYRLKAALTEKKALKMGLQQESVQGQRQERVQKIKRKL